MPSCGFVGLRRQDSGRDHSARTRPRFHWIDATHADGYIDACRRVHTIGRGPVGREELYIIILKLKRPE